MRPLSPGSALEASEPAASRRVVGYGAEKKIHRAGRQPRPRRSPVTASTAVAGNRVHFPVVTRTR
jgi:hypothetical protein